MGAGKLCRGPNTKAQASTYLLGILVKSPSLYNYIHRKPQILDVWASHSQLRQIRTFPSTHTRRKVRRRIYVTLGLEAHSSQAPTPSR